MNPHIFDISQDYKLIITHHFLFLILIQIKILKKKYGLILKAIFNLI
jgi:hypothetical protein